ncbi:transcriptional regulator [Allosphingosinicella sp.]|uniref:winged helix-turn-helix domain-containing protein n=1 Tax=Allosphingosinicella sp. TaxID=2823234 RepID=UPI002EDA3CE8
MLDPRDRQLRREGAQVELNARYLDALTLLVGDAGKLVSKDRFLDEVWRGVPVTDEALTQCIKTLRRQLGDDAARPRFIETVPKHGYRFIAPVERADGEAAIPEAVPSPAVVEAAPLSRWRQFGLFAGAGILGAGVAGIIGGLFYGFAGASQPLGAAVGAASVLLVLLWLTIAAALMGGAGVSAGIAAAGFGPGRASPWVIAGGALGGLFTLLGGRLMGGSLDLLARTFPDSRLRLDPISGLFGENGFGPVSQIVTGTLEGALFAGCVLGAMLLARRSINSVG